MRIQAFPETVARSVPRDELKDAPPWYIEYIYYLWLFYAILGDALELSVSLLGAAILGLLVGYCVLRMGDRTLSVYKPLFCPLACATTFIIIQLFVHDGSLMGSSVRSFVPWLMNIMLLYSLSLREGFLLRFSFAALVLGICLLPFLNIRDEGLVERVGLDTRVGLSNPNDLSAWFGFLFVYFTTQALDNYRRPFTRALFAGISIGCLIIVALTVSRAPILAGGIAVLIAGRHVMKRGFFPLLCLAGLSWMAYNFGVFDKYFERGAEETGRLIIWPLVLERFLNSPWIGVGVSEISTIVSFGDKPHSPHNSFLLIGLVSGVVPLVFYVAYWWSAARGVFQLAKNQAPESQDPLPLFIYSFLEANVLNFPFMFPWLIATLSEGLRVGSYHKLAHRLVQRSTRDGRQPRNLQGPHHTMRKIRRVRFSPRRRFS